ncbi:sigma-70 family RNA polymerase sigma factor [Actinomadura darangshiensis]|uniref:sigma-70 family RNA polymerase sigma factor n=1 Tax=Actinomadura darangshiensis TaxID=705336 RepID=UPI002440F727|nr:sigma-70 family RNA polymerase sigma factor [Actinomadura darangshiensis]
MTVNAQRPLAELFEARRPRLQAIAHRMLGSSGDAEDAVQEAWLRLSRSEAGEVRDLDAWLTTVVARVSLSILRARRSRREEVTDERLAETTPEGGETADPEREALLADSVGLALLVVLDTLRPAERLSFVLHDLFDVPFDRIAPIIERSPAAARQLASRARRRVQGAETPSAADARRRHEAVAAFLAASRGGDFEALLAMLDPDVILRADQNAARMGAPAEAFGSAEAARFLFGRAGGARPALVDGIAGAVWTRGERTLVVFRFAFAGGRITGIDLIGEQSRIARLDLKLLA